MNPFFNFGSKRLRPREVKFSIKSIFLLILKWLKKIYVCVRNNFFQHVTQTLQLLKDRLKSD